MPTTLKRRHRPNPMSLKRIEQLNAEAPVRIALCRRAHGHPSEYYQDIRFNDGTVCKVHRVVCHNGICECSCGRYSETLEPHEKHSRGRGGKLSLENSIMVSRDCHNRLDPRKVKLEWIGD